MTTIQGAQDSVGQLLSDAVELIGDCGRSDLEHSLRVAADRVERPGTVVCIVGEFKQGKSAFVNALVGEAVCPVDDDLTTSAVTLVEYAAAPVARVSRVEAGKPVIEEISFEGVAAFASEEGNPGNTLGVSLVEIGLPSSVLEGGLTAIDTPGVGALRQAPVTALADFLQYADAMILVTDASAELSAPEMRFLERARALCPTVLVALTKIDLYLEWRRIADLNTRHLDALDLADSILPVSSPLHMKALQSANADLDVRSGFPDLLDTLQSRVLDRAHDLAAIRAVDEVRDAVKHLGTAVRDELEALRDPEAAEQWIADLQAAQEQLARLQEAGTRWAVTLNDAFSDLRSDAEYLLRSGIRSLNQEVDSDLVGDKIRADWDEVTETVRDRLATLAVESFDQIHTKSDEIAEQVAAVINAERPQPLGEGASDGFDVVAAWSRSDRSLATRSQGVASGTLAALRGGYSGMLMLGMLGQLAGLAMMLPITVGAGALLGTKQLMDERKRHVVRRRNEARTVIRQFLAQAQDELSNRAGRAVRERHRALRDYFTSEIKQMATTAGRTVASLRESLQSDEAERQERIGLLQEAANRATRIIDRAEALSKASSGP